MRKFIVGLLAIACLSLAVPPVEARCGLLRGIASGACKLVGRERRQARRAEGRGLGRFAGGGYGGCADGSCAAQQSPPPGYELVPK
jgi:hypothetical protein